MTVSRQLLEHARELVQLARHARTIESFLTEAATTMPGADYDRPPVSGAASVVWCWVHEREVKRCTDDGHDCTGEPVGVSDRTGEAAINPDGARRGLADLRTAERAIDRAIGNTASELGRWTLRRPPTQAEITSTAATNLDPGCHLCARVKSPAGGPAWWNPPHRTTDLGGLLPDPVPVCHAHIRRAAATGQVPSTRDTEFYRDHDRWPPERIDPKASTAAAR